MHVRELIEYLEEFDGDSEVRIASQPAWPFENSIDSVVTADPCWREPGEPGEKTTTEDTPEIAYITEGSQIGYLPGDVASAAGW